MTELKQDISEIKVEIHHLRERIDTKFNILFGMMITLFTTTIGGFIALFIAIIK